MHESSNTFSKLTLSNLSAFGAYSISGKKSNKEILVDFSLFISNFVRSLHIFMYFSKPIMQSSFAFLEAESLLYFCTLTNHSLSPELRRLKFYVCFLKIQTRMHGFLFINENATAEKTESPVNQNVLVRFSIFFKLHLFF